MHDPRLQRFGQTIRAIRKQQGLSQEKLAELANIDRSYMGHIERGEKNLTFTKIYQVSEALGIHPSELFE